MAAGFFKLSCHIFLISLSARSCLRAASRALWRHGAEADRVKSALSYYQREQRRQECSTLAAWLDRTCLVSQCDRACERPAEMWLTRKGWEANVGRSFKGGGWPESDTRQGHSFSFLALLCWKTRILDNRQDYQLGISILICDETWVSRDLLLFLMDWVRLRV